MRKIPIVLRIDGQGSAITTGDKVRLPIPFDCVITGWTIVGDVSGSIVIDVQLDSYANYPPTAADSIAGTEKPSLSSSLKNRNLALATWNGSVAAGSVLNFSVDSASSVTGITLVLEADLT